MKISFNDIEERLQTFLEGSLTIFPWGKRKDQIAPLLMAAIRSSITKNSFGQFIAPSSLIIYVHPHSLEDWQNNLPGLDALARILQDACHEADIYFQYSPKVRLATSYDLGEDEFTQGRLHPMIDPSLRNRRIVQEAGDPSTAVILLDIVLGYGSNMDPAGELLPAIQQAQKIAAKAKRDLVFVGLAGMIDPARAEVETLFDGSAGIADYQCSQMLRERYHRLAPVFPPGLSIPMDAVARLPDMIAFAEKVPLRRTVDWLKGTWMAG